MFNRSLLILAAGRSSRMQSTIPKALSLINGKSSIQIIISELNSIFDNITVVCSEHNKQQIKSHLLHNFPNLNITYKVQFELNGTFNGVRSGCDDDINTTVLLWCDQPMFTLAIVKDLVNFFEKSFADLLLPIAQRKENYTQVVFDSEGKIDNILQARNGDIIEPGGFSDCGLFIFNRYVREYFLDETLQERLPVYNNEISFLDLIYMNEFKKKFNTSTYVIDEKFCTSFNTQQELKELNCE